jgi:hypothetical protein
MSAQRYELVRRAGATHDEVMEAIVLAADLPSYAYLRGIVRPHAIALRESGATNTPERVEAGRLGVTDDELAALRLEYAAAIEEHWRALVRQEIPVRRTAPPIPRIADYLAARRVSLSHDVALWFAARVCRLTVVPATRDVELWARCLKAGLDRRWMFSSSSTARGQLKGYQLETLHAGLFVLRSLDEESLSQQELLWVARRADNGRLDMQVYVQQRCSGHSARRSLRLARLGARSSR